MRLSGEKKAGSTGAFYMAETATRAAGIESPRMRSRAFQRRMGLMALLAMLLLVLMPVASRLLAAGDGAAGSVWSQMCTTAGLKLVKLDLGNAGAKTPQPAGDMPMGDDCPYCPVLNAIASLALCIALVFPRIVGAFHPRRLLSPPAFRWHPCGLGSRGPPLAL